MSPPSRARRIVRRLRETAGVGWAVRGLDRVLWWRVIRRSGLIDAPYYAAQLGVRRLPADAAIAHYVARGYRDGLSLNPLVDEIVAGGNLPEVFRVPALYAYLRSDKADVQLHPLWDAPAYGLAVGVAAGALEHAWSHADGEIVLNAGGGALRRLSVARFREEASGAARGWRRPQALSSARAEPPDVLVVRMIQKHDRRYGDKLAQAARLAARPGTAVVLAIVQPDASQWTSAALLHALHPRISVGGYRAGTPWEAAVRSSVRGPTARTVVILDARAGFADDEVDALTAAAVDGAVAPVHRGPSGTVAAGAATRVPGMRGRYILLHDHPHEDLSAWGDAPVAVPALSGRSVALPGGALARALQDLPTATHGDPLFDWTEHLARDGVGSAVLASLQPVLEEPHDAFPDDTPDMPGPGTGESAGVERAARLLQLASFAVDEWSQTEEGPRPRLRWVPPTPECQRWAIKICAPPGRPGEVWGDTHFAVGLARALRRAGQEVVIDAFGASRRSSSYLDDISVVVRGPYRIDPPDTGIRIEWIISHPDEVTVQEARSFDRVFAASTRWSAAASARWGIPIGTLLECTDTDQFFPKGLPRGDDIVFVGTARGIARPSVVSPLSAGIPVKVYGPDWRPFIPTSAVAAEFLPNAELPERYETASIVLNDQWPAMRRHGFIAMRPFDAVAVGARVISEEVDDIEEIFGGAVVAYRDEQHLIELLRTDPALLFPSDARLREIAAYVREAHSFDARVTQLLDVVRQERARTDPSGMAR